MGAHQSRRRQRINAKGATSNTLNHEASLKSHEGPTPGHVTRDDHQLVLERPVIVPMTEEQFERAASTLAELLLWAWDQERDERRAA